MTSNIKIRTLLYTLEGETIKVLIEAINDTDYRVVVKGFDTDTVEYPDPSFIFSEPCFLDTVNGHTLTEYRLIQSTLKGHVKVLNLAYMKNLSYLGNFAGNQDIRQLHLPTSLRVLEKSKFLESVEKITNSPQITHIGDDVFNAEIRNTSEIEFSDYNGTSISAIGKNAFKGTNLKMKITDNLLIMNRLTIIEESSFEKTTGIDSLEAKNLEIVPKRAFYQSDFKDLNISKATVFEKDAFTNMKLETITIGDINENQGSYDGPYQLDLEDLSNFIIYVPTEESRNYLLGQIETNPMFTDKYGRKMSHENIVIGAWYNTSGHTKEEVIAALNSNKYTGLLDSTYFVERQGITPDRDVLIAFRNATSITDIDLNGTLSYVSDIDARIYKLKTATFRNFTKLTLNGESKICVLKSLNLEHVNVKETNNNFYIKSITTLTFLSLPNNLSKITINNGFNNLGIASLNLPSKLQTLEDGSFANNKNLSTINLNHIQKLPNRVFADCPKLKISLNNIDEIGTDFMKNNTALTTLTIPSSLSKIGENAFNSMSLNTLKFDNFKNPEHQILTNCTTLKAIYLNSSSDLSVDNKLFDVNCKIYVNHEKNYEVLIENTFKDTKPIYVLGNWLDSDALIEGDFSKIRDKESKIFHTDFTNYTGDELYLIQPNTLKNIETLENLTKLTIENCDLSNHILPINLKHLELKNCLNVNLNNLTNLTYFGSNNSETYNFNNMNNLKILNLPNAIVEPSTIEKPEELVVLTNSAKLQQFKDNLHVLDNNIKTDYFNTSYLNYQSINGHSNLFDLERRLNHNLSPTKLIISNINYINPINLTNLIEQYIFDSKYFDDFEFNKENFITVYTHNILTNEQINLSKLKPTIKYFKLDDNITYTHSTDWTDFMVNDKDAVIVSNNQSTLQQLFKNSNIKILKSDVETLNIMDIYAKDEKTIDAKNCIWGIYSGLDTTQKIKMTANNLETFDYSWTDESLNPIDDSTKTIYATFEKFIAPKLTTFKYSEITRADKAKFILNFDNLKELYVNVNVIETMKTYSNFSDLEIVHFGPDVNQLNATFSNCNNLKTIYLETDNLTILNPSIVENPSDVIVYIYDENVFEEIHANPNNLIENLPADNVILFNITFNTQEHTKDELIEVYTTGICAGISYTGINDNGQKFYEITIPSTVSENIKALNLYKKEIETTQTFENILKYLSLQNIKQLTISGKDVVIYHIGSGSGDDSTRGSNIASIDLSTAIFRDNTINDNAFKDCTKLKRVVLNESIETIGDNAFDNCPVEVYDMVEIEDETTFSTMTFMRRNFNSFGSFGSFGSSSGSPLLSRSSNNLLNVSNNMLNVSNNIQQTPRTQTNNQTTNNQEQKIIANFKNPSFETYKTFDDSIGIIEQLIHDNQLKISDLSTQYEELKIYLTDCEILQEILMLPIKTLTLYGFVNSFKGFCDNILNKNNQKINKTLTTLNINTINKFTITKHIFENSNITNITGNIGWIEDFAFKDCKNLVKVDLIDCEVVGESAFENCNELSFVNLPEVKTLGDNVFKNCVKLTNAILGTAEISASMFVGCNVLTNIISQTSIIHKKSFKNSTIKKFTGCCVETFEDEVFANSKIETIECPKIKSVGDSCFIDCSEIIDIELCCEKLGKNAFKNCEKLQNVKLPNVRILCDNTFENCKNLQTIDLNNIIEIGNCVFKNCNNFKNETLILNNLEKLGNEAFMNTQCSSFIGQKVKEIGVDVFKNTGIFEIRLPNVNKYLFEEFDLDTLEISNLDFLTNCKIKKLITSTTSIMNLKQIVQNVEEFYGNELMIIDDYCFMGSKIKIVSLPKCLSVGKFAFCDCSELVDVALPVCASIGDSCFKGCSKLVDIKLPNCLSLGDNVFENCVNLQDYEFNISINDLGCSTFKGCSSLKNVKLYNIQEIHANVFDGCLNILNEQLDLNNIIKIGDYAFANSSITKIKFYNVVCVGKYAFYKSKLNAIIGSENIKEIGDFSFAYTSLTLFNSPKLTIIPKNAFIQCKELKEITVQKCITNKCSYNTCTNLKMMYVLDLDLISGITYFDDCNFDIYVLRNFKVPLSISGRSTFKGNIHHHANAIGIKNASSILRFANFIIDS